MHTDDRGDRGWEAIEHTADVGIHAWAPSLPEVCAQTMKGLMGIVGVLAAPDGSETPLTVVGGGRDVQGALVEWLGEALYLQDSRDLAVTAVEVAAVKDGRIEGRLSVRPRDFDPEGTQVKAITFHRISVEEGPGGWTTTVYLDV